MRQLKEKMQRFDGELSGGRATDMAPMPVPGFVPEVRVKPASVASLFLNAAVSGDCKTLLRCFEQGVRPDVVNKNKQNVLHLAAMNGRKEVVELIVSLNFSLNRRDKDGNTAIMLAAAGGYGQIVNKLVLAKADVLLKNTRGETVLHHAAAKCSAGVVTGLLIKNGNGARDPDKKGNTPLDIAKARASSPEGDYLVYLLDRWAPKPETDKRGYAIKKPGIRENMTLNIDKFMVHDLLEYVMKSGAGR